MGSQRLNRYNKKKARTAPHIHRGAFLLRDKPIHDAKTGFIQHPSGFPLEVRRKWLPLRLTTPPPAGHRIGILFDSEKYIKPGTTLEITIPLQKNLEKFTGQVILVRQTDDYYEIGLGLNRPEDAGRARIVEQICHIERYMQEKKYREGPYNLNPERVASEWIAKYAGGVPTL